MQDAMKSIGQQFVEYKPTWEHINAMGKTNLTGVQFVTPKMAVKSFGPRNAPSQEMQDYLKTLVTGGSDWANDGTSGGALVIPQFSPIIDSFYQRPLMIRDLVTNGQTDADVIFWVQVNTVTNNAAPTAEAANAAFGNGYNGSGQKPESAMDWVPKSSTVKTIAHWIPITQKALQNGRQIQTYINEFMRYGLDEELEDQIVSGDGNGENFEGIMETPGIIETPFMVDLFKSARRAKTEVKLQGRTNASAYVLHPYDVETLDTSRESNTLGAFYGANPLQNNGYAKRTLWGLPVVESEVVPEGKGICANWRMAMLWDRMQSTISISNSHLDFFTRNLLAILGEASHAFAVIRPKAFAVFDTQEAS
jgi:HK97 family phage major capsid protein